MRGGPTSGGPGQLESPVWEAPRGARFPTEYRILALRRQLGPRFTGAGAPAKHGVFFLPQQGPQTTAILYSIVE